MDDSVPRGVANRRIDGYYLWLPSKICTAKYSTTRAIVEECPIVRLRHVVLTLIVCVSMMMLLYLYYQRDWIPGQSDALRGQQGHRALPLSFSRPFSPNANLAKKPWWLQAAQELYGDNGCFR